MGTHLLSPKKGAEPPPKFSVHVHCGQTAGWIKMALGMEVDIVLDGDPATLPKKGTEPPTQFFALFYCGQTAACIKMPLGTEVNLGPPDVVLNGSQLSPP